MQLRKEELRKQGKVKADISKVSKEDVSKTYGITKDHMIEDAKILQAEENTENLGNSSAWLCSHYGLANYGKSADQDDKEVLFIQTSSTKGITFKINVDGFVVFFSFDTDAHISCVKYDMVATLGLFSQISDHNISIRTAHG